MTDVLSILSAVFLLLGSLCNLIAGIGLFRFPDFYSRMHATGITDSLGTGFILVGLMLLSSWDISLSKLILILAFILLTGPTITYSLANAAKQQGLAEKLTEEAEAAEKNNGEGPSNH
ncbi:monovalent cation/H(+) antiporter subunit G [Thalassomonas viridans]|uniref:Monovalent cation/H(+) antiporter subunit G n=1 Tax=Thalassomonas viridans TaxID=137584 RepID=A0AAE9ZFE4_9GAMM|nr:monovalent cation/H(+) antiporter subunit G [Thalassomonas viridans]WDE09032.1 monovalent cation/H(+) antiporter subunit G [Thalassomonas viridans]